MGKSQKILFYILASAVALLPFQNCGQSFKAADYSSSSSSTGLPPIVQLAPGPGVSNSDYLSCYAANSTSATGLATCLNSRPNAKAVYTDAQITTCLNAMNTSAGNLAMCLSKNGQVIQDYRQPKQMDINQCATAAPSDISFCLAKHGVRMSVTNTQISQCTLTAGASGVELCLHKNGYLATPANLFQADVDLCNSVEQGTATLAQCLYNEGVVAASVTQPVVDTCVTAAGVTGVAKCLRNKYFAARAVTQYDFDRCNSAVGQANEATCLANQGMLPVDTSVAANVAAFQTNINTCVTNVGQANVAKCLRKNGFLSNSIMQPHINACFQVAGSANVLNCLSANFPVIPAGLTAVELNTCFANNGNTPANAAKCLASKRILPSAASQDNITACNYFAGQDPDATGTLPGQIGIANCLAGSGLLPAGVLQANIDTCITNVGLASASACLSRNNFIPSFAQMIATGGVFQVSCSGCHSANNMSANLDLSSHASTLLKVVPGSSAASALYVAVNSGSMPKNAAKLAAGQITQIQLWIDQGANNN